jgi:serine/threonine-protein kinase
MSRFLRLVVERTVAGRSHELKERLLGIDVFDRRPDYDPRLDPIVRVEARRLRSKLEEYYRTAGRNAGLRIALPKGAYIPRFGLPEDPRRERAGGLAVLPVSNSSRDPDYNSFCAGITQEIIHAITTATRLRVVAWPPAWSAMHELDVRSVGREIGVSHVLCGTLRVGGARARLLAQLIETSNGEYVWSECYNHTLVDLLDTAQELSRAIVSALQVQLGVSGRPAGPDACALNPNGQVTGNRGTDIRNMGDFKAALELGCAHN